MKQEDLVLADGSPHAVNVGGALDDSTLPCLITAALRVEVAVGVVDMQDDESLGRCTCGEGQEA